MIAETLLAVGAGTTAAFALPFTLPAVRRFERARLIPARPADVFARLDGAAGYQSFNPFKAADPQLAIEIFGPARGIGSGFHFKGRQGSGTQTLVALDQNRSATYRIDMGAFGVSTHTFMVAAAETGSQVTWRVEAEFGANPAKRVFGAMMERFLGPICEDGLARLDTATTSHA
jgi:hypothetical protein